MLKFPVKRMTEKVSLLVNTFKESRGLGENMMYICTHIHIHIHAYTHMHTCILHIHSNVCIHIYIGIYACVHIYTHITIIKKPIFSDLVKSFTPFLLNVL